MRPACTHQITIWRLWLNTATLLCRTCFVEFFIGVDAPVCRLSSDLATFTSIEQNSISCGAVTVLHGRHAG